VTAAELVQALRALLESHREGITHIWLRRPSLKQGHSVSPLAEFVCGSGVRAIVIYPWRTDGCRDLGQRKPANATVAAYLRFGASVRREGGRWYAMLSGVQLRRFFVEHLFCHEVGHHVDHYNRHWSKANGRLVEDFADQYAVIWGPDASAVQVDACA